MGSESKRGIWRSADYAEQTQQLAEKAETFTNCGGRGWGGGCDGEGEKRAKEWEVGKVGDRREGKMGDLWGK